MTEGVLAEIVKLLDQVSESKKLGGLSNRSDVSLGTLSNFRKGAYSPRFNTVLSIVDALGMELVLTKKKDETTEVDWIRYNEHS